MTAYRSANLVRVLGAVAAGALITAGAVVPANAASNPPAPRSVRAAASSGAVTLSWTSGKGSTKGFNVYRSTSSKVRLSSPVNGRKLIVSTSYRSAGLTNGRSYWFVVQSVGSSSGLHAQAATIRATPHVASPLGPTLSAVPGSTTVKLTWSPRSGGGPVSTWSVYRSTSTKVYSSANLVRSKLSYGTRAFTDTGLKNGTTYHYVVTAVNAAATVPSLAVAAEPQVALPSAPVLHVVGGDKNALLTWTAGAGGGAVASWNIYRSTTEGGTYAPANLLHSQSATITSFSDSSVANGDTYYYAVAAVNVHGAAASTTQAVTPQAAVPGAPVALATAGDTVVSLSWTPGKGGGTPTGWDVYRSTTTPVAVTSGNLLTSTPLTAGTLTYQDASVTNDTKYYYVVVALNSGGGTSSNQVLATPEPAVPAVPSLQAAAGDSVVSLTWSAGTGGGAAASWSLFRSTSTPVATTGSPLQTFGVGTTTYQDTSVTDGTTYYYVLVATNTGGSSSSVAASATPTLAAPTAATLQVDAGDGTVGLSWTPGTGGGAVAGWTVYRSTTTPVSLVAGNVVATTAAGTTSYDDGTVTDGTEYYYVVTADNAKASTASNTVIAVPSVASLASLSISNPDAVPGSDRFVMSRMEYYQTPNSLLNDYDPDASNPPTVAGTPTWYRVHDVATVHVTNTGSASAQIDALTISDPSSFSTTTTVPLTIAAGASVDIPVRFIYPGGSVYGAVVRTATLTITATGLPDTVAQLAGEWQPGPNRAPGAAPTQYFEPYLSQIVNGAFGWTTDIGSTGLLNDDSGNDPFGDEHVSNFWQAADSSQPVTITRIAAFTGSGLGAVNWYPSSDANGCSTQSEANCNSVLGAFNPTASTTDNPNADPATINPADAQVDESLLPLQVGDTPTHSFSPGSTQFGLQIGGEFSDNSRNDETNDIALDHCVAGNNCGHHMRFFPVIDANGVTVPNTWIVAIDLGGLNNDFNDDVLVVSNLAPVS